MANEAYTSPGVDVKVERREVETRGTATEFYPVFVGTGVTTRNKVIVKEDIKVNTDNFPIIRVSFSVIGEVNTDLFEDTKFDFDELVVKGSGGTDTTLVPGTGFTVEEEPTFSTFNDMTTVYFNILDETVSASDLVYDVKFTVSNTDADFDLRLIGSTDRFFSKGLLGPPVLKEGESEFFNDIAIAADLAFRRGVPRFYYLEVPRNYGEQPTIDDYREAIDKIYFTGDAYRIVPLSLDPEIQKLVAEFTTSVSNPLDRRETVGFVTYDVKELVNMNDVDELVDKVGGFSGEIDSNRISNVFCGESVEYRIDNVTYVLPPYFMTAAVVMEDAIVGPVDPLSTRRITLFNRINGPRFRPREWDRLAQLGVFIIQADTRTNDGVIRHQLTTARTGASEDQEYSVVKNFDVVTKLMRDRFAPYAGRNNITSGYIERLDATMTTVIREVIEAGLARELEVLTSWRQRDDGDGRNLVTRIKMVPVYPANHLDIYLIL